jgi:hypothetical protein
MNYQEKYLKYKGKYLSLKSQIGGIYDTFYIYTTGIAEWGHLDRSLKLWNDTLCKQICDIIPRNFTKIHIVHSDILKGVPEEKKDEIFANILDKIEIDLVIDPRIVDSNFQTEPLDFAAISIQSNPYIIIDIAHLCKYVQDEFSSHNITRAFIAGAYGEPQGEPMNLNVIYLGYMGGDLINTSFFRVNEDNTITTYINKLLDASRFDVFDLYDPNLKVNSIFSNIQRKIWTDLRAKNGNLDKYDRQRNAIEIEMKKRIVDLIMDTDINESLIIENVRDYIMRTFFS